MDRHPWLTIIGVGEDGPDGLNDASRAALAAADVIIGPPRHLALLADLLAGVAGEVMEWPVPFADGIPRLLGLRGRKTVMLASGDPFWFGAGTSVTRHLERGEWCALPAPSTFGLAAARLGWALETTLCLGLHAAPLTRLRPHLAPGVLAIVLLRDGAAVAELAAWLVETGFGATALTVLEALGGVRERVRATTAETFTLTDVAHPVAVGLKVAGEGAGQGAVVTAATGRADSLFDHDGQITKRPVRALTLSALAPRPGEHLWDLGAGSGSIAIEWLWSHPANQATAVEADPTRAARLRANAARLGVDRLHLVEGKAVEVLGGLPRPDAVFIGGGLSQDLLDALWACLPAGCRVVANAVTLESEALLAAWHERAGGSLLRIELAEATALGTRRGWKSAYPVVQWSGVR